MKTVYVEGYYWIKIRGRGVMKVKLSKNEAKVMLALSRRGDLELESVQLIDSMTENLYDNYNN